MGFSAAKKEKTTEVSVEMPQFARINGSICHPFLILFESFLSSALDREAGKHSPHVLVNLHPFAVCLLLRGCCTWAHRTFYAGMIYKTIAAILITIGNLCI